MARPLREEEPGATYHVTCHAVADATIVRDDEDRAKLVSTIANVVGRQRWICLAVCVMDTHLHLLVTTPDPNLAEGMCLLNGRYAQSFNRCHGRRGHLFRERYRPTRVASDAHLLLTVRYIARNPLEPRLADHPCDYRWSSYAGVVGAAPCWPFVSQAAVLEHVGNGQDALRLLREFVEGDAAPASA